MNKNPLKFILEIFVTLFIFACVANAATLKEYRENIEHLKTDLSALMNPDEDSTEENEQQLINEISDELPERFPPNQKIEWEGGTVETDNAWLINKFASFKDLKSDAPERRQTLLEIYERLEAVEQKIVEFENATASNRTKDEEKQKLSEILKREEYARPEEKEESMVQKAYREFWEWLKSIFPKPSVQEPTINSGSGGLSYFLTILIYAAVIGLIGFLLYKFAPFIFSRIKTCERKEKRDRVILGEKIAADETSDNLFSDAERMAREGDLRGAIRKGYIALLCDLSDRKIIGLSKNKTNRDYLRDVKKRRELHQNMNGLTNNFERHWYGFQEADETDWSEFRDGYQRAVSSKQ